MNALYLTVFVSSMLAVGAVVLFTWGWSRGEHEHVDRLTLLPLEDDTPSTRHVPDSGVSGPAQRGM